MSGQRTEAPTTRRRDEARQRGQSVGRSHELAMVATLGVGLLALASLLPGVIASLSASTTHAIYQSGDRGLGGAQMVGSLGSGIAQLLTLVLPLALLILVAGVAANLVSGGLVFSIKSVRFDPSRLNPISGLRRIVDRQALVRLAIASTKLGLLVVISWQIIGSRVPSLVALEGATTAKITAIALGVIYQLGLSITILLAVVALADAIIQRRRASGALKMTKDEVKREHRESEGDPLLQAQRRRRARQMAFARMMDAVPTADVVVTNPIHLAVALKYDSLTMRAPKIVAKGQRLMAARIKETARANGVPIIEDVPLARALYPRPLGGEVPPHLYRAVAHILIVVQQARFGIRRERSAQPHPSSAPSFLPTIFRPARYRADDQRDSPEAPR